MSDATQSPPARRKVIGRILSLGFPLPGTQVDNYNFLNAPAFFDYDAIVVDPLALATLIDGLVDGSAEAATFTGAAIRNEPRASGDVALGDILARRRNETAALLANGGVIVCVAHPETAHRGVGGIDVVRDYDWLPAGDGVSYGALLERGEGSQAMIVDWQHPLAAFVSGQLANIAYRAHCGHGVDGVHVYARSQGGAGVAVEMPRGNAGGRVIFVPALRSMPAGDARYAMSDALQAGVRRALGGGAAGRPPSWVSAHPLPGLDERAATVERAQQEADAAQVTLEAAQAALDELAKYQRLLWQEGSVGLDDVVLDALRLIGCDVYANNRQALEMRVGGESLLFEIEASEHAIDMAAHHRLRQRLERAIEQRGAMPRGVLFVNGQRLMSPTQRTHEISDSLRVASLAMRYCVTPTSRLYDAVAAKLAGHDDAVDAFRKAMASHDGLTTADD